MKRLIFPLLAVILFSCAESTTKEKHTKLNLEDVKNEFVDCKKNATEKHSCKTYVAKAINGHFEITDFNHPEKEGEYVAYDQIAEIVDASGEWKMIGEATEQGALDYVQKNANEGKPALAISTEKGIGNIAIVVKGEQVKSSSWGLNCPSVAIFFPNKPEKSFIGKTLNYAWGKPDGIKLYVRE